MQAVTMWAVTMWAVTMQLPCSSTKALTFKYLTLLAKPIILHSKESVHSNNNKCDQKIYFEEQCVPVV